MRKEINQFIEYCQVDKGLVPSTVTMYKKTLKNFYDYIDNETTIDLDFKAVTRQELRGFIQEVNKNYTIPRASSEVGRLKTFYKYLIFEEIIDKNPFDKIRVSYKKPKKVIQTLSKSELQSILNNGYAMVEAYENKPFQRYLEMLAALVVVELIISTGARINEVLELRMKDIDFHSRTLTIFGKGKKERKIYLSNLDVIDLLQYFLNIQEVFQKDQRIFIDGEHCGLTYKKFWERLKKFSKDVDKRVHAHLFRHSFATMLLNQDVDLIYIKYILGHSTIKATEMYLHIDSEKQKQVLQASNPRRNLHPHKDMIKRELERKLKEESS